MVFENFKPIFQILLFFGFHSHSVNASQQCESVFKLRASKALINQPIYINTLFTDDYI